HDLHPFPTRRSSDLANRPNKRTRHRRISLRRGAWSSPPPPPAFPFWGESPPGCRNRCRSRSRCCPDEWSLRWCRTGRPGLRRCCCPPLPTPDGEGLGCWWSRCTSPAASEPLPAPPAPESGFRHSWFAVRSPAVHLLSGFLVASRKAPRPQQAVGAFTRPLHQGMGRNRGSIDQGVGHDDRFDIPGGDDHVSPFPPCPVHEGKNVRG